MLKYIKLFEKFNTFNSAEDNRFVKCNNCDWFGREKQLNEYYDDENGRYISGACPICNTDDYLMDVHPGEGEYEEDFIEYTKEIEEENVNKDDYDNIEDYIKALYPNYIPNLWKNVKKYNL